MARTTAATLTTSVLSTLNLLLLTSLQLRRVICQTPVTICPSFSSPAVCTIVGYRGQIIFGMVCSNLGSLTQLPLACNQQYIIQDLTINPNGTQIENLQASILDGLSVVNLVLAGLEIRSVDPAAFSSLNSNLQSLNLGKNQLTSLSPGVFSGMSSLSSLGLAGNQLTAIGPSSFNGLDVLTYLDLADNQIRTVLPDTWEATPYLTVLNISNNNVSGSLQKSLVAGLNRLKELRIENNLINGLQTDAMSEMYGLVSINASRNNITTLPPNLFVTNTELLEVDLSSNAIDQLAPFVFNGTYKLASLYLNDNKLVQIPVYFETDQAEYVFRDMYDLRVLNLRNNRITGLLPNTLSGMSSLRYLDLGNNSLTTLPIGIFDPLGLVETLLLDNNQISQIDSRPFESMVNLVTLNLSWNRISWISADWFNTTTMIASLHLDNNIISSIDKTSFDLLKSLRYLDLSSNLLANVDGLFLQSQSLQTLNLAFNPLGQLPDAAGTTFVGLYSLQYLNLSGTCLSNVTFSQTSNFSSAVRQLHLSRNNLRTLSATTFAGLYNLQLLDLSNNNIEFVESGTFASLTHVQVVNLSTNYLTSSSNLGAALSDLSRAKVIDLSWNVLDTLKTIPTIDGNLLIVGNPITCSCTMLPPFLVTDSKPTGFDIDSATCWSPQNPNPTEQSLACYWNISCSSDSASTPSSDDSSSCSAPQTALSVYDLHEPSVCVWGQSLALVKIIEFTVAVSSSSSIYAVWNVTGIVTVGGNSIQITVTDLGLDRSSNDSDSVNLQGGVTTYSYGVAQTSAEIGNLTASQAYAVCIRIVQLSLVFTIGNVTCRAVVMPVTTTSTLATSSSAADVVTITSSRPSSLSTTPLTATDGRASELTTVYASFVNQSDGTSIQTTADPTINYDRKVGSQNADTLLIIIIAASVGGGLLLALAIVVGAICCHRRRRRPLKHGPTCSAWQIDVPAYDLHQEPRASNLVPTETIASTRADNTSRLAQQNFLTLDIYDHREEH